MRGRRAVVALVPHQQERVDLEGDLRRVERLGQVAGRLRLGDGGREPPEPLDVECENPLLDAARVRAELRRNGREEAPAREDVALDVRQELVGQRPEAGQSFRTGAGPVEHLAGEDLVGALDGREPQLLLRLEVRGQPALAHAGALGESADRKAVEAVDGGQLAPRCRGWRRGCGARRPAAGARLRSRWGPAGSCQP